jgi:hypothetical protein
MDRAEKKRLEREEKKRNKEEAISDRQIAREMKA